MGNDAASGEPHASCGPERSMSVRQRQEVQEVLPALKTSITPPNRPALSWCPYEMEDEFPPVR